MSIPAIEKCCSNAVVLNKLIGIDTDKRRYLTVSILCNLPLQLIDLDVSEFYFMTMIL